MELVHPSPSVLAVVTDLRTRSVPVLVGFSGGADSTLALLWSRETFGAGAVVAVHFDHVMRGEESDGDAVHAESFSRLLGVRYFGGRRDPSARGDCSEAALRRDRLGFFNRAARHFGATHIVTGHHADDVVESLLMRIARGAGTGGLASPRPVSNLPGGLVAIRPLLALRRDQIADYLRRRNVSWREDSGNANPSVARRNAVRHRVVPEWIRSAGENPVVGALRSRSMLEEDDAALTDWAMRVDAECGAGDDADFSLLRKCPAAVVRRVLHRRLAALAVAESFSAAAFDGLLSAILAGTSAKVSVARGLLEFDGKRLALRVVSAVRVREAALLPVPGLVVWPDGASLSAGVDELFAKDGIATRIAVTLPFLTVAPRVPGERYVPAGAPGRAKISDQMINRKIPASVRDRLPVVSDAEGAIWVPGLLPADRVRADSALESPLRLTWTDPDSPWPPILADT